MPRGACFALFRDRIDAGQTLALRLRATPAGQTFWCSVCHAAVRLRNSAGANLDVFVVRKPRLPSYLEYAIGARPDLPCRPQ